MAWWSFCKSVEDEVLCFVAAVVCPIVWSSRTSWPFTALECHCWQDSNKSEVLYSGKNRPFFVFSDFSCFSVSNFSCFLLEWRGHWSHLEFVLGTGIRVSLYLWISSFMVVIESTCFPQLWLFFLDFSGTWLESCFWSWMLSNS